MSVPHPLDALTVNEIKRASDIVLNARGNALIEFRSISLEEPPKAQLQPFFELEAQGKLTYQTPRPARQASIKYDVVCEDRSRDYMESLVDVNTGKETKHRVVDKRHQPSLTLEEFEAFQDACTASQLFKDELAKYKLPEGFVVTIDPWPYGGPDPGEIYPRYTQGLCFARDARNGNPDSNHYGYPLPMIPVMDTYKQEIVRIDKLATGGTEDGLRYDTTQRNILDHCAPAEYVPELLEGGLRTDLKPLNVIQPEGPSFKVSDESVVEWQKWRFRVGFNPREGATLHDIRYDGRSVLYRLSISEMTVPYGDPRPPFHRKQAFDFGDAGAGRAANNLELGCDCLGLIKYFDAVMVDTSGAPSVSKNVICLHEQDNGIGWKHTNYRTNRAVVTRYRELVIQFIITLANYEYIFMYKFDQAGGIDIETRATGIVSVVNIDPGKTSPWGNVVSPGALAQNHQHVFCLRIDPAIDGPRNTILKEESLPIPMTPELNPFGNGYEVRRTPITRSSFLDASPQTNRVIKMINPHKLNPISGRPIGYKFTPTASQLLLAHPDSIQAKRAQFAQHHVWITKHRDGEFWAGGEFTNQSQAEVDGVADAVARDENVQDDDVVVWNVFGLTHNPRVEDWPVMPMESHSVHLRPVDFFTRNPAIDVPGSKNLSSVLAPGSKQGDGSSCCSGKVQSQPTSHGQGQGELKPQDGTHKL
ncbi:copper amine oxidase [Xylona heveae TC161]|uniref:Amine oxidase n=1 Tax=Xylona heveae (strain CBS 132557 / TC161) TaxID=1328760 RepID=A0A165AK79_XYLHT|nr:copper amine oxidase [Xylona heveae TC161]KZF20619.1 copper amine oxidase [Xylona heveae TC161]